MLRALDLFCGAGGVSAGLVRAGFDVTGVDLHPQPQYPYRFVQADWSTVDLAGYDLVWASPPCQAHTQLRGLGKAKPTDRDFIDDVRSALVANGTPWVIENVLGAPLRSPVTLCGSMFGLAVRRHRLFEASFPIPQPACACRGRRNIAVYGKAPGHRLPDGVIRARDVAHGREAMGIGWMDWKPLTQAIPPAYAEHIGQAARAWLARERDDRPNRPTDHHPADEPDSSREDLAPTL